MPDNLPNDDAKNLWQSQTTEKVEMSSILIRSKSRDLRARTRRKLMGLITAPAAVAFFYAFGARQLQLNGFHWLFALTLAWSLAGLYVLSRGAPTPDLAEDAGLNTGLEFCRRELERQRAIVRGLLIWSLAPMLTGIATFLLAVAMVTSLLPKALPFLGLLVIWLVSFMVIRWREQRSLERELKEIREIERTNRA